MVVLAWLSTISVENLVETSQPSHRNPLVPNRLEHFALCDSSAMKACDLRDGCSSRRLSRSLEKPRESPHRAAAEDRLRATATASARAAATESISAAVFVRPMPKRMAV